MEISENHSKTSCFKLRNAGCLRHMVSVEDKVKSIRYFTSYQFNTFPNALPQRIFDFRLYFFRIHDFQKFSAFWAKSSQNHSLSTLFGRNPLKMDTNIIDFLEITSSLRGHSSMMAQPFSMSRHSIITYSRRSRDSRRPYSVKKRQEIQNRWRK